MARVLVLGVKVPFTHGGQDVLVRSLVKELGRRGHEVDSIELPFTVSPKEGLLNQIAIWRALEVRECAGQDVDLVIATKFPSYFVKHPRKSLWCVHQHRAMYDLYAGRYSDFGDDPRDEALRGKIFSADNKALAECAYLGAISKNVADRISTFHGLKAEALYPPLPLPGQYRQGPYEDFILSVGRICSIKRVDLMLKALPVIHPFIKLKIVGVPDEPAIMDYLKNEIDKHHLWERVEFVGRAGLDELLDLYSRALGVYYAPFDEDYGYVTLEAMASAKPVIAAKDSGGVLEFVEHEYNGLVVDPNSDSIGKAVNRLVEDRDLAARLGAQGLERLHQWNLADGSWDKVITGLLSPLDCREQAQVSGVAANAS